MRIFFTSDLHISHENILKFEPYRKKYLKCENINEHDKAIIGSWNSIVKDDDIVYVLGDLGFDRSSERQYVNQLKGIKILIRGNHDQEKDYYYYKLGFSAVMYEAVIKIGKTKVLLSHYPYRLSFWSKLKLLLRGKYHQKDQTKRPINRGMWLLHGHIHSGGGNRILSTISGERQINVGLDANKCKLISAQEISNIINKK